MSSKLNISELNFIPSSSLGNAGGINGLEANYAYPTGSFGSGLIGKEGKHLYTPRIFSFHKDITIAGKSDGFQFFINDDTPFFTFDVGKFIDNTSSNNKELPLAYGATSLKVYGAIIFPNLYRSIAFEVAVNFYRIQNVLNFFAYTFIGSDNNIYEFPNFNGAISVNQATNLITYQQYGGSQNDGFGVIIQNNNPGSGILSISLQSVQNSTNIFTEVTGTLRGFVEII